MKLIKLEINESGYRTNNELFNSINKIIGIKVKSLYSPSTYFLTIQSLLEVGLLTEADALEMIVKPPTVYV